MDGASKEAGLARYESVVAAAFSNSGADREITEIGVVGERLAMWGFGYRVLREMPASTGTSGESYNGPR